MVSAGTAREVEMCYFPTEVSFNAVQILIDKSHGTNYFVPRRVNMVGNSLSLR